MRNVIATFSAALLICWASATQATPVEESASPSDVLVSERAALQAVIAESRKKDADRAALTASLKAVLAAPAFASLSDSERHTAYFLYGAVLFDLRNWAEAQVAIKTASEMPQAGPFDWDLRLRNDFGLHDYADAVAMATQLARKAPEKLTRYSDNGIFLLWREAEKLSPDVEGDFLEAMHEMGWHPKDEFTTTDRMSLSLIRIRLAQGDTPGAKAAAARLRDPASILALHIDKRFDAVVKDDPEHFDVMKTYETSLADLKAKTAAAPDKLEGVNFVAEDLIEMTRYDEALALVSTAHDRLKADPKAFGDAETKRNWTEDILASALFDLGRGDEGFAALAAGAAQKEDGRTNVSQAINLAEQYNLFDRPKDALAALTQIDLSNASDYGRMALQDARACAYFGLGDTANFGKAFDYMKTHRKDGPEAYLNVLVFTGKLDDAAEEVIAELQDLAQRAEMLGYLQDYAPALHPTKRSAAMHETWIAIRNRPDVAAEIAKVGYINKYDLHQSTF